MYTANQLNASRRRMGNGTATTRRSQRIHSTQTAQCIQASGSRIPSPLLSHARLKLGRPFFGQILRAAGSNPRSHLRSLWAPSLGFPVPLPRCVYHCHTSRTHYAQNYTYTSDGSVTVSHYLDRQHHAQKQCIITASSSSSGLGLIRPFASSSAMTSCSSPRWQRSASSPPKRAAPTRGKRRARSTVAAAPSSSSTSSSSTNSSLPATVPASLLASAAANHLSGFYVRAVEPRESSILNYTSAAAPGTHTDYFVAVADVLAPGAASWVVARRFSAFLLLRDELLRGLASNHCPLCAALKDDVRALAKELPRKRIWGSGLPSVVRRRADKFLAFLRALLALATNAARLRCPIVCFGFAVQLRTFLTRDGEHTSKQVLSGDDHDAVRLTAKNRSLLALAIREDDEEEADIELSATRRGSYAPLKPTERAEDTGSDASASTRSSSS